MRRRAPGCWSIKLRVALTATACTALVLAVGVAAVALVLRSWALEDVRVSALEQSEAIAARLDARLTGGPSPSADELRRVVDELISSSVSAGSRVRVIGPDGAPAVGPCAEPSGPCALSSASGARVEVSGPVGAPVSDDAGEGSHVIVTRPVDGPAGRYTVVVAAPTEDALAQIDRTVRLLGLAAAALTALTGAGVYLAVRASLRPVARIMGDVAAISRPRSGRGVRVPRSGDEIEGLATTMNEMLERLALSDESRRRFVSDASHELRSPVATLQTHLETAPAQDDGRVAVDREVALNEVRRLGSLVDGMLTITRSDGGGLDLQDELVDLDDVVLAEVRRLRLVTEHEVTLHLEPVQVRGDAGRLSQVLRNLLDNADRHARGRIRVMVGADGEWARVDVDNEGDPIAPADRERVFERFARLDEARSRDRGGSGLGLAIARMLARAHGGTLVTGCSQEGWCRFSLTVPRADEEE